MASDMDPVSDDMDGTLTIKLGPMFSGKSTWLRFTLTELADQGFTVVLVSHTHDVRTDVSNCDIAGSTHNSTYKSLSPKVNVIRTTQLATIDINKYQVVGVDEAQFYDDLRDTVYHWVTNLKKYVYVAGLDGDSNMKKFGQTLDLIPFCDDVSKISGRCRWCLAERRAAGLKTNPFIFKAPFTKRIIDAETQTLIGGGDAYIATCRRHHHS